MDSIAAVVQPKVSAIGDPVVANGGLPATVQDDAEKISLQRVAFDRDVVGALLDVDSAIEIFSPLTRSADGKAAHGHIRSKDLNRGPRAASIDHGAVLALDGQRLIDDDWPAMRAACQDEPISRLRLNDGLGEIFRAGNDGEIGCARRKSPRHNYGGGDNC